MRRLDLDYMMARYFSAHLGRFQSVDPIGGAPSWPQSWNRYSYVLGNPMKYTDPEGLQQFEVFDQIDVTSQPFAFPTDSLSITLSVLGLLSGPGSTSSGPAFVLGPRDRVLRTPPERRSRSLIQELFCPEKAQGVAFDISTINPFTSGGGGAYGFNLQYVPGKGLGIYTFGTPNSSTALGFDIGVSVTVNQAVGNGPWSGDFLTAMGSFLNGTGGGFGTPSDQVTAESIGWHGVQAGGTFGFPVGAGATITRYTKEADLSFLTPWCQ